MFTDQLVQNLLMGIYSEYRENLLPLSLSLKRKSDTAGEEK